MLGRGGYRMRKALSFVLISVFLVVVLLGTVSCKASKGGLQEVTYNLGTEPAAIDPAITTGIPEANIELQVFDGLTRIDDKNVPQPAIAESWTISADLKTYTFTLRDATWTNGTPVTADDFEYAWKRALSPELASEYAYQLYYVSGGEAFNKSIKVDSLDIVLAVDFDGLVESFTARHIVELVGVFGRQLRAERALPGILEVICCDRRSVRPGRIAKRKQIRLQVLGDRPALRNRRLRRILAVETRQPVKDLHFDIACWNASCSGWINRFRLSPQVVRYLLQAAFAAGA